MRGILEVCARLCRMKGAGLGAQVQRCGGFTLIELLVGVSVVSILVALAMPNFNELVARQQVDAVTQALRDHLQLARNYAQAHQVTVQVCPVTTQGLNSEVPVCSDVGSWQAWLVTEVDGAGRMGAVIARSDPVSGVLIEKNGSVPWFSPRGATVAVGQNGTIKLVSARVSSVDATIVIAPDGRIR